MLTTLIKHIHACLSDTMPISHIGICGGSAGLALFHSLYSYIFNSEEDSDISIDIINNIDINSFPGLGLKYGCLGLAFATDSIIKFNKFNIPDTIYQKRNQALSKYLGTYRLVPIKYIPEDEMFSEGMYMLHSFRNGTENELEHFYLLERMIGEVDTCFSLMKFKAKGIYDSENISILNLCSIIKYLQSIISWKVYPTKARELLRIAQDFLSSAIPNSSIESLLKSFYSTQNGKSVITKIETEALSYAGFIAYIFGEPAIFERALYHSTDIELENCDYHQLLGLGIGIELLFLNGYVV